MTPSLPDRRKGGTPRAEQWAWLAASSFHALRSSGRATQRGPREIPYTPLLRRRLPTNAPSTLLARRAFTLLEVMLVAVLSATLLAVLWGLFAVYVRLFETGQAKTEQAQLARALLRQIADDLGSAIEDSPANGVPNGSPGGGGPVAARRFGLLGTRHALRIDVLQTVAQEMIPPPDTEAGDRTTGLRQKIIPRVPELRTILYDFQQQHPERNALRADQPIAEGLAETEEDVRSGLTRREMDFETPLAEKTDLGYGRRFSARTVPRAATVAGADAAETGAFKTARGEGTDDALTTWLPEVVGLEFRYFDGSGWSDQWNSLERKSLPVAVEVAIQVQPAGQADEAAAVGPGSRKNKSEFQEEAEQWQREAELQEALGSESDGYLRSAQEEEAPSAPIYRLVIDVPGAKKHPALKASSPVSAMDLFELLAPPPLPPLLPLPEPVARPMPTGRSLLDPRRADQWMRVEP